jgi:hypothetical protein
MPVPFPTLISCCGSFLSCPSSCRTCWSQCSPSPAAKTVAPPPSTDLCEQAVGVVPTSSTCRGMILSLSLLHRTLPEALTTTASLLLTGAPRHTGDNHPLSLPRHSSGPSGEQTCLTHAWCLHGHQCSALKMSLATAPWQHATLAPHARSLHRAMPGHAQACTPGRT